MNRTGQEVELDGFVHIGTVPERWQEQDGEFPGIAAPAAACGSQALCSPENPEPNTSGREKEFQCDQSFFPKPNSSSGNGVFLQGLETRLPVKGGWLLPPALSPARSPGSAPCSSAHAELSETFKNPSGTNSCWCCGGEGAGSGGAADLGAVGGDGRREAAPRRWHIAI